MAACCSSRSSQSIGFAAAHWALAFDQSYDTMPNCAPRCGFDHPLPLHVITSVDMLMLYLRDDCACVREDVERYNCANAVRECVFARAGAERER